MCDALPMPPKAAVLISISDAASRLEVPEARVEALVDAGALLAYRLAGDHSGYVLEEQVDYIIEMGGLEEETGPTLPHPLHEGDDSHPQQVRELHPRPIEQYGLLVRVLGLMRWPLEVAPQRWDLTFANDFSALACFTRAYRQLRAAALLADHGYYSEVGTLLRAVYESAALGRLLAHTPEEADRWLREGVWFPDRKVRKWFGDEGRAYATIYGILSAEAHPTAMSCLELIDIGGERGAAKLDTQFDDEHYQERMTVILGVALWACIALRNAAASEELLPPEWRKELSDLAKEIAPWADFSELERNWEAEQQKWQKLAGRVGTAAAAEEMLKKHPFSWDNLSRHTATLPEGEQMGGSSEPE